MENFDGMSHEEMKARLDAAIPSGILEDGRMWRAAADRLQQSVAAFTGEIASAIDSGWEGTAAGKASSGVSDYSTGAAELQGAAVLIANKIEEAHSGIDQARRRMPEPESTNVLDILRSGIITNPIGGLQQAFHKSEEARQEAIQVMKSEYAPVVQQADSQVPVLPAPHNPVADPSIAPPPRGPADLAGPGDGTDPWVPPAERARGPDRSDSVWDRPGDGGGGNESGDQESGIDSSETRDGVDGTPRSGAADGAGSPFAGDAATRAASTDAAGGPGSAGYGAGGTGSGGTGAGGGTGGGAGAGLGSGGGYSSSPGGLGVSGGGSGGSGAGGSGRSAPGFGSGPGGGAPAVGGTGSGAGAAAGRPGAPGMGAMAPGGARGGGDDDTEHKTPGYLINVHNGSELIGDLPKVAPPVLGG